jgi:hypothetical protein
MFIFLRYKFCDILYLCFNFKKIDKKNYIISNKPKHIVVLRCKINYTNIVVSVVAMAANLEFPSRVKGWWHLLHQHP